MASKQETEAWAILFLLSVLIFFATLIGYAVLGNRLVGPG